MNDKCGASLSTSARLRRTRRSLGEGGPAREAISRRRFLGSVGGAAAGLVAASRLEAHAGADRPNIILILADDLGYNGLSCYGQQRFRTPNIDRLAAEGLRLTSHYAGSPVCAPSRCALLTGLHTGHAYIRANDELNSRGDVWANPLLEGQRPIPAGTRTIGHVLQEAGYETAIVGKWGLGGPRSSGEPGSQGFDYSFGFLCQRQAHNHYPDHLWRNGERVVLDNPIFSPRQALPPDRDPLDPRSYAEYQGRQYAFDVMLDDAMNWLRRPRSRPFFLHFAPTIPHLAVQVPEDSLREYEGRFPETPYKGEKGYLPHRAPRAAYAAMIARMDAGVGRLMRTVAELGVDGRTLVIFTSDNGRTYESGGHDPGFFAFNAPLRGAKQDLWEGGIRVPFVARWPGQVRAGRVNDEPCASWDLLPTFAQLAGARASRGLDGVSLQPLLTQGGRVSRQTPLYWEFKGKQAVRDGRWKAVHDVQAGTFQLFDLEADLGETKDLAGSEPRVAERLRAVMRSARTESALFPLLKKG